MYQFAHTLLNPKKQETISMHGEFDKPNPHACSTVNHLNCELKIYEDMCIGKQKWVLISSSHPSEIYIHWSKKNRENSVKKLCIRRMNNLEQQQISR